MNNHSSHTSNQSQSITLQTQLILPDRLRAEKQITYLKKKELEAEEMSNIEEGAFVETKKVEKSLSTEKSGAMGHLLYVFEVWDVFYFFFLFWTRF